MIKEIIEILRSGDFYGGTENIEFAKGSNELVTNWKGFKRKAKRKWLSRRK